MDHGVSYISTILSYLNKRAWNLVGNYEENPIYGWERPRLIGCEMRAFFNNEEMKIKYLNLLPISEKPTSYFANICSKVLFSISLLW